MGITQLVVLSISCKPMVKDDRTSQRSAIRKALRVGKNINI